MRGPHDEKRSDCEQKGGKQNKTARILNKRREKKLKKKGNRRNRRNRPKKAVFVTDTDTDRIVSAQRWGYHFRGPPEHFTF